MTGAAGLRSVSRPLDAEEHAKLRRLAFARGSVIEHDRISIPYAPQAPGPAQTSTSRTSW